MTTNEILLSLRKSRKISQKMLADLLGVSTTAYQNYEYGKAELNYEGLKKLADFYGVTTDYLLGREPAPSPLPELCARVDDQKFIELYSALPEYAKQIFVDTMSKLAQAAEQANQKQRHVERLGDIEDEMDQERQAQAKDVI